MERPQKPPELSNQQLTYGVVSEGFFVRKICGKFAEIYKNYVFVRPQKGAGILRKVVEISWKFAVNFLQ